MDRRAFIQIITPAPGAGVSKLLVALRPQRTGPIGANDRVRRVVIGVGNRANELLGA